MPRVNIFIRKANEDKWNNIPDKSNWVNTLLENSGDTSRYGVERETPVGPVVEVLSENIPEPLWEVKTAKVKKAKLCKVHGIEPRYCVNMKH